MKCSNYPIVLSYLRRLWIPSDGSYEGRQDLLDHKSDRMTTHYSAPDIARISGKSVCAKTVLRIAPHAKKDSGRNGVGGPFVTL